MGFEKQSKLLRIFHNKIKSQLINQYASNTVLLYDIGVGRGGDLFKWKKAGVEQTIGYDIDKVYIDEALHRMSGSEELRNLNYDIVIKPDIKTFMDYALEKTQSKANVISCQFAIHYFFQSEDMADDMMKNVSENLEEGGFFIGTYLQGETVLKLTNNFNTLYENTQMMIKPTSTEVTEFGSSIDIFLVNTLYFGDCSVSSEYVVTKPCLIKLAQKHGLKLIAIRPFEEYFKFANIDLHTDTQICSFAYATFVFQKLC
jgi:mRNA (guanine-N7-)-methyltransferase